MLADNSAEICFVMREDTAHQTVCTLQQWERGEYELAQGARRSHSADISRSKYGQNGQRATFFTVECCREICAWGEASTGFQRRLCDHIQQHDMSPYTNLSVALNASECFTAARHYCP